MTHEGLALGHAAAAVVGANAGEEWTAAALLALVKYARKHQFFTVEAVRLASDVPDPHDKRAWGWVARSAQKLQIVKSAGWVRANSRTVHGMVVTRWESLIFTPKRRRTATRGG